MIRFTPLSTAGISQIVKFMEDFYAIDNYAFDADVTRENFAKFLKNPSLGNIFLIRDKEDIIGYIIIVYFFSFEFQGKVALLDELYLTTSARGKGVGKKAMEFVNEFVENTGCKLILLEVEPHNTRAQKLYLEHGFTFHKRQLMRKEPTSNKA